MKSYRSQATEDETISLPPLEKLKIRKKQLKLSKKSESPVITKSTKSNKVNITLYTLVFMYATCSDLHAP